MTVRVIRKPKGRTVHRADARGGKLVVFCAPRDEGPWHRLPGNMVTTCARCRALDPIKQPGSRR